MRLHFGGYWIFFNNPFTRRWIWSERTFPSGLKVIDRGWISIQIDPKD